MSIRLDQQYLDGFLGKDDFKKIASEIKKAHEDLHGRKGAGSEFTGWVDLPGQITDVSTKELTQLGKQVREQSDALVSIGIGGSYLGIRSTIEFLGGQTDIPVHYAGHHMSTPELGRLLKELKDKRVTLVVISKSGTTTEPALAFRFLKDMMVKKYGEAKLKDRIVCVTDQKKGALKKIADAAGYRSYVIPDDVGGRFSVLTPVGLVPLACAGVDISALVKGARQGQQEYANPSLEKNLAYQYAAIRYLLFKKGKLIEVLASFYPNLFYVAEWWKQLFGESEGKDGQGIFPASVMYSSDLHSMGQLMQDGLRMIFETFVMIDQVAEDFIIPEVKGDLDGFNCVAGKGLDFVNKKAHQATAAAHYEGDVPNLTLTLDKADAEHLGQLYYFFEKAVAISGYLLGVNPFDQPGVEAYKSKMFQLLGKG